VFPNYRRFAKALILVSIVCAGTAAFPPQGVRAETSYHRLKRKLHKLEHDTGEVIQQVGEVAAEGLEAFDFDFIDIDELDLSFGGGKSKAENAESPRSLERHERGIRHEAAPKHQPPVEDTKSEKRK
jgi:hypothetical protein